MLLFTNPRTTKAHELGPKPNTYVDMYSWAFRPYNSPSKFCFLAPREGRRILMFLGSPQAYHVLVFDWASAFLTA